MKRMGLIVMVCLVVVLGLLVSSTSVGGPAFLGKAPGAKPPKPSPTPTPSPTGTPPPPPPTGFANETLFKSGADDWEPAMAVDPGSNWVYQMTTRYGGAKACSNKGATACPTPNLIFRASSDAGATWGAERFLCACQGTKTQADPEMEVASDGTIYATWMNDYTPGVVFAKSSDRGATWTAPTTVGGGLQWTDKPIIAISPTGRDVYIAFNKTDSYVASSHDFGATWGAPVKTNNDSLYWFAEGGAVAPNGDVYFSASGEVATVSAAGDVQLAVIRSTNGGTSWTHTIIDTSKQGPAPIGGAATDFFFSQANIAVDPAGKLMVAYTLNTVVAGPKALYVKTSTDGVTWSARTQVNAQGDSGFPVITSGPTANDFRVAWQDDRGGRFNTWYKRTTNGGGSWSADVKLSNLTSGAPYKNAAGYAFPYGDYFEMETATNGTNHVIWSEGPDYAGPGGAWYTKGA